jgi:hypothetical protein
MDWLLFLQLLAQAVIALVVLAFAVSFFLSITGLHPTARTRAQQTGKTKIQ